MRVIVPTVLNVIDMKGWIENFLYVTSVIGGNWFMLNKRQFSVSLFVNSGS